MRARKESPEHEVVDTWGQRKVIRSSKGAKAVPMEHIRGAAQHAVEHSADTSPGSLLAFGGERDE